MPERVARVVPFAMRAPSRRRLAAAVALALAALSGAASAAGLGRLTVHSALGQPLRAEVEIHSIGPEEAATLAARLAPPEAFRQAGLEFGPSLQALRFAIERRGDGRAVVRISSVRPIEEPFIDLLVELSASGGRLLRQYTFLLDPPELRGVQQATGAAQPALALPQADAPPAGAEARPDAARVGAGRRTENVPITGDRYEVARGDTLATIALRARPAEATVEQTAVAIYRANPEAFAGSPDVLRAGAALRLPDAAAVAAVDAAQARRELRLYLPDFRAYRERIAAAPREVEPAQAGQAASGRIQAGVEEGASAAAPQDRLRLSRGAAAPADARAGATGSQPSRLAADEQRAARAAALAEVDARVRQIERTMADLRQLIELKDRSLAALQKQLDEARAAAGQPIARQEPAPAAPVALAAAPATPVAAPAAPVATPAAPAAGVAREPQPPAAPAPASEPPASPTAAAAPAASTQPPGSEAVGTAASPPAPASGGTASDADRPAGAPASAVSRVSPAAPAESDAAASSGGLLAGEGLLPALGGVALLGAGWMWLRARRRRAEQAADSLLLPDAPPADPVPDAASAAPAQPPADEPDASARAPVQEPLPEVDPVAEAEVYMAYGREQQAEQILREALSRQPDRQPVRLKLMELYAGRKDVVAFGELAGELYAASFGSHPDWPQVAALGRSIDPDNPVYADDEAGAPVSGASVSGGSVFRAPASGAPRDAAFGALAAPWAAAAPALSPAADLGGPAQAPGAVPAASGPQHAALGADASAADEEITPLAFELDLDAALGRHADAPPAAPGRPEPADRPDSDLLQAIGGRFDLPSLDLDDRPADAPASLPAFGSAREAANLAPAAQVMPLRSVDLSGISLELEPLAQAASAPPAAADADGSARWQEMSTKLDLAAAYEEIGDREGARELLDEVLREGDAAQQQRARSMLARSA